VIEVTPEKEIVWEQEVTTMPYDVERLEYGDEPSGPPIDAVTGDSTETDRNGVSPLREVYTLSLWVLPPWIGIVDFYGLLAAGLVALCWGGTELALRAIRWRHAP